MTPYTEPVSRLLSYGDASQNTQTWPDYVRELGLNAEHAEQLIAMATDPDLNESDQESLQVWAPMHAWRALGQLGSVEAVQPLLELLDRYPDDDWVHEDLPEALALIGEPAIEPLAAYLMEPGHDNFALADVAKGLCLIAEQHEHCRERCVAAIAHRLRNYATNSAVLNGLLIGKLMDIDDLSHIDLIEQAFEADAVDCSIAGDFEDVQLELGLIEERRTPRPNYVLESLKRQQVTLGPKPITKRLEVGRNDPCPCGSGKKYKKCCLLKQ